MRYSAEHKAGTHERIVKKAAALFREHGADGMGIASLMKDLGLTNGGFYKHFKSKDDLYAEAVARGFEDQATHMEAVAASAPKGSELKVIIETYLTVEHLQSHGQGCLLATLASDIARQPEAVRLRINAAMRSFVDRASVYMPGRDAAERRRNALLLMPSLAGVLMTARVIEDPRARESMLASARQLFIKTFAQGASGG